MATFKVEGKDVPLGADFSNNHSGRIRISDIIESLLEKFNDTEIGIAFKEFTMESVFAKLKGGDTKTLFFCGVTILCLGLSYLLMNAVSGNTDEKSSKPSEEKKEEIELKDYTIEQLRIFDGKGEQPIYIALKGDIFDVSSAREFYGEGSGYNCFAGREATRAMAKLSFEEADLCNTNLDDLNALDRSNLDDWYSKFKDYKCYPIIGRVSAPLPFKDYSLSELLTYKECTEIPQGRLDAPILMGINGKVIDVSFGGKEMYGKGGPYFLFAGIDASKALAKMSFKEEDLKSRDLSDLTPEQQKTLADWEKRFIDVKKYPVVGKIVEDATN